jgi:hypothetical protein
VASTCLVLFRLSAGRRFERCMRTRWVEHAV